MKLDNSYRVSGNAWIKREFNPKSKEDLNEYKYYLTKQRWRQSCPFLVEWPFTNAVAMIEHKIVRQHLGSIIKTIAE